MKKAGRTQRLSRVLPDARAQVPTGEERDRGQGDHPGRERGQCGLREEGSEPAPNEDGQAKVGGRAENHPGEFGDRLHHPPGFRSGRQDLTVLSTPSCFAAFLMLTKVCSIALSVTPSTWSKRASASLRWGASVSGSL